MTLIAPLLARPVVFGAAVLGVFSLLSSVSAAAAACTPVCTRHGCCYSSRTWYGCCRCCGRLLSGLEQHSLSCARRISPRVSNNSGDGSQGGTAASIRCAACTVSNCIVDKGCLHGCARIQPVPCSPCVVYMAMCQCLAFDRLGRWWSTGCIVGAVRRLGSVLLSSSSLLVDGR